MDGSTLERQIGQAWASRLGEGLCGDLIALCQTMQPGLQPNVAANFWDDVCVAYQNEASFAEAYGDQLRRLLHDLCHKLDILEKATLWLQTHEGGTYAEACEGVAPLEGWPVKLQSISQHVFEEHVLHECWNYTNSRIREATER
jgi:hypothetical protein